MKKLIFILALAFLSINLFAEKGNDNIIAVTYCESIPMYWDRGDIFNVTIGTLNNSSDCSTLAPGPGSVINKYSNYTTTVAAPIIGTGTTVPFSLNLGTCTAYISTAFKIYIDFNHNGSFADAGEEVYGAGGIRKWSPYSVVGGNITIPEYAAGVVDIGITRMRIVNADAAALSSISSCGTYYWGETEDYNVNIVIGKAQISTSTVTNVTATSASSGGNVLVEGSAGPVSSKGVCWSLSPNPTINDSHTTDGSGSGIFSSNITNLYEGLTYYLRAYATNSAGTSYGQEYSFNTGCGINSTPLIEDFEMGLTPPTYCWSIDRIVSNPALTNNYFNEYILLPEQETDSDFSSASYNYHGKTMVDYCVPVVKSNTGGYGILNVTIGSLNNSSSAGGYADFTSSVSTSNLPTGTQTFSITLGNSYYAAFGIYIDFNQNGSFTDAGEFIYNSGAYVGGTVNGSFTSPTNVSYGTTRLRIAYMSGTYQNPCYDNSSVDVEDYSVNIIQGPPTVSSTTTITNISAISATSGGIISSTGASSITQKGVCWSTSVNPTIANSKTSNGSGTGSFSSSLTNLTINTTYHVRAYATNIHGTSYGPDLTFNTNYWDNYPSAGAYGNSSKSFYVNLFNYPAGETHDIITPTFDISSLTNPILKFDYAYATRTSENDQLAIYYSTDDGASFASLVFYNGGVAGELNTGGATTSNFVPSSSQWGTKGIDLPAGTNKVKYRVLSANGNNLYIDNISIESRMPIISTNTPTNITVSSATSGGSFQWSGHPSITEKGVCWGTSTNPTISGSHSTDGSGIAIFSSIITGLSEGTTYYVRAYATNSYGTAYGNEIIFTSACSDGIPPFAIDFESTFPTICWENFGYLTIGGNLQDNVATEWKKTDVASAFGTGTSSIYFNCYNYFPGVIADYISRTIDLGGSETIFVKFDHAYASAFDYNDRLELFYSTDDGITYTSLINYDGGNSGPLNTGGNVYGTEFFPTSAQWATKQVQLPAGTNKVKFRAYAEHGNNMFIDNISFFETSTMTYVSSATTQTKVNQLGRGTVNQQIIGLEVVTASFGSPLTLTNIALNTTGTTAPATDITNAKIYYTGTSNTFATSAQFGSTVASPNGAFNLTGTQQLVEGTNYFWLTYDIPADAVTNNSVDAECTEITIGSNYTPSITAPTGTRNIADRMIGNYTVGLGASNNSIFINPSENYALQKVNNFEAAQSVVKSDAISNMKSNVKNNQQIKKSNKELTKNQIIVRNTLPKISNSKQNNSPFQIGNGDAFENEIFNSLDKNYFNNLRSTNSAGDYATITEAIADLNATGISGPVTFNLLDNNYPSETFPIVINEITGASSTNTITIKPASGVTSTISGSSTSAIIKLNGTDYFTLDGSNSGTSSRDLTITNTSTDANTTPIWLASLGASAGSVKNTIKNCNLNAGSKLITTYGIFSGGTTIGSTGADNDDILIQNNSINSAYFGISAKGSGYDVHNNIIIADNDIGNMSDVNTSITYCGIYLSLCENATISGNHVMNVYQPTAGGEKYNYGIFFGDGVQGNISKNIVESINYAAGDGGSGRGIAVNPPSQPTFSVGISNNVIFDILGDGNAGWYNGGGLAGIYVSGESNGVSIYYNSVYLSGTLTYSAACTSANIYLAGMSGVDMINNVLVNSIVHPTESTSKAYNVFSYTYIDPDFDEINNNNYSINSGSQGYVGYYNADLVDLAAWKTAIGQDANSISADPGFTSATNLKPNSADANSWSISGAAKQVPGLSTDITGESRPTAAANGTPDMGAYEFGTPSIDPIATTSNVIEGSNNILVNGQFLLNLDFTTLGGIPSVNVKFYSGAIPSGLSGSSANILKGYFIVNPTSGSSFKYNITYYYSETQLGNLLSEADIRLSKSTDGGSTWTTYSVVGTGDGEYQLDTDANSITVYGLTSFSTYILSDQSSPLPVELISFTVKSDNIKVLLNWTTATEVNNYGFDIERCETQDVRSEKWEKIGFIEGHGNSNSPNSYQFVDEIYQSGNYLYRLKQIDTDGKFEYSDEIEVEFEALPTKYELAQNYPNPFNPSTVINFQLPKKGFTILKVYDILGREVANLVNDEKIAGKYSVKFDASNLASGIYFSRLSSGDYSSIKKMLLIK